MESVAGWFLFAYAVGTVIGVWIGFKSGIRHGSGVTIDALMETGFLKYKKDSEGEITLLKPDA
jgi:hypothetical protein